MGNADKYYNFQGLIDNINILGEFVKDDMLPIAVNDFGDYITIGIRKKENGCIFKLRDGRQRLTSMPISIRKNLCYDKLQ